MTAQIPEWLAADIATREAARHDRAAAAFAEATDRERALIHDAAVMGYVQGLIRSREEGAPKDSQVIALVIQECLAFPDLYPAVAALAEAAEQQGGAR
ncbi:hypothetical protein [Streptomyces sp. XC 2026]|uniref:hypothetical protein n=1 Tax=Streptomyces sp. XC 2026 TaxID=2782004 RepID=UPI0019057D8D|nr:hypothetical protein [Streptomyces sp. XC 2026]QQN79775.1 hypothetical protein IPZ77_21865 [Streptomyces sp. XC 2026]QQN80617.1 hypothetical protein IPZ77_26790 [Streptomyces sp. XC 2026]